MQIMTVVVLLLASSASQPEVLGVYPADELTDVQHGKDIQVVVDKSVTSDGGGSLKVTFTGSGNAEAMLFAQQMSGVDNAVLWYEVDIRCEEPAGMAYAAMWTILPDGNSYFSRGLDQPCTQEWRRSRIPFLLEKGQRPDRVVMGVRFNGPGTVWLDNARLVKNDRGDWTSRGMGVFATVFGVVTGIWGALAGILVSRGKGKTLVVGLGVALLISEVVMLGVGVGFLAAGRPVSGGLPWILIGAIGSISIGLLVLLVLKRYRDFEAQRLAAQDASDSL
ncbi:MAG: hypothetical protein NTZ09_00235 [Candidatus Hydrogenedentes bacterium]|nr:hypothetical protein [Candidatus Hydrogenedentota bacterium]